MRLSKSRFMECFYCQKRGWLSVHRPDLYEKTTQDEELFKKGNEVGEIAKKYFGDYDEVEVVPDKGEMIQKTKELIKNGSKIIAEASFSDGNCYCAADIVKITGNKTVEVYEVKSATSIAPEHLMDMAYQYHVITNCGFRIDKFCHLHINSDYLFDGELDIKEMIIESDCTEQIKERLHLVRHYIPEFRSMLDSLSEPECDFSESCHSPHDCPYFDHCKENLPPLNVFDLRGSGITFSKKLELYSKGIITYQDILANKPKLNEKRMNEIKCAVYKSSITPNIEEIKKFLNSFQFPIYFLDFETYQAIIPTYTWQKPFQQMPFQYSLHILYEDGRLEHKELIAPLGKDPRYSTAKRLLEDILDDGGSIVAYNARFEKMVIKELANVIPHLYGRLLRLNDRFVDLMDPFVKQWVYMHTFKSSCSIKYILPALFPDDEELNYKNLDTIQNGTAAMTAYANLINFPKEEQERVFKCLFDYCCLDTYAMVKIYWWLVDLVKNTP